MTGLSGRTREDLQAEADLLQAREEFATHERLLKEALTLNVIMTTFAAAFPEHGLVERWVYDIERDVQRKVEHTERVKMHLDDAEARWASHND